MFFKEFNSDLYPEKMEFLQGLVGINSIDYNYNYFCKLEDIILHINLEYDILVCNFTFSQKLQICIQQIYTKLMEKEVRKEVRIRNYHLKSSKEPIFKKLYKTVI